MQFLRTSYKAAPLIAIGLACLAGPAAARLAVMLRRRHRLLGPGTVVAAVLLLALAAWPLMRGRAVDDQLLWKKIPATWRGAANEIDRVLPGNTRAVVIPGQLFAYYDWGGTIDPILPALAKRPVAVRTSCPTPTCMRSTCCGAPTR